MEYTRLLIKFTRPIVRELFENTLRNVLEVEIDIEWNHKDNSAQIEIYNFDHNTQNLQTLFMTLGNDFNTSLTIFNVPFFDEFISNEWFDKCYESACMTPWICYPFRIFNPFSSAEKFRKTIFPTLYGAVCRGRVYYRGNPVFN